MTTLEVLKQARELISVHERWTQNASARAKDLTVVDPEDSAAVCWCATGAVRKIARSFGLYNSLGYSEAIGRLTAFFPDLARHKAITVTFFNDTHEHSEVLDLFDKAIEYQASLIETPA